MNDVATPDPTEPGYQSSEERGDDHPLTEEGHSRMEPDGMGPNTNYTDLRLDRSLFGSMKRQYPLFKAVTNRHFSSGSPISHIQR